MKRRVILLTVCLMLIISTVVAPVASASKVAKIFKVSVGANVRNPNDIYDITGTVKKGTKVLWTGKTKKAFYLVTTANGKEGYIYRDYLSEYGAVNKSQLYRTKSSCKVYKSNSTKSKKVKSLSKGTPVMVYATQGDWAYVKTASGKGGFMKRSTLTKF